MRWIATLAALAPVLVLSVHSTDPGARPASPGTAPASVEPSAPVGVPRFEPASHPQDGPAPAESGLDPIRTLLLSSRPGDRSAGFRALASLDDRAARCALLRELLESDRTDVQALALAQLVSLGGPEAVTLASLVLGRDHPSWLRWQAADVLGALRDPAALAPLMEAWSTDDLVVRAGVAGALAELGRPAPMAELLSTLTAMLDDADGGRREEAVELLSCLRGPGAVTALSKALGDMTNSRIREAAAHALGCTGSKEALPYLEAALNDPAEGVRRVAQNAVRTLRAGD